MNRKEALRAVKWIFGPTANVARTSSTDRNLRYHVVSVSDSGLRGNEGLQLPVLRTVSTGTQSSSSSSESASDMDGPISSAVGDDTSSAFGVQSGHNDDYSATVDDSLGPDQREPISRIRLLGSGASYDDAIVHARTTGNGKLAIAETQAGKEFVQKALQSESPLDFAQQIEKFAIDEAANQGATEDQLKEIRSKFDKAREKLNEPDTGSAETDSQG